MEGFALTTERLEIVPMSIDYAALYWEYHQKNFAQFSDYLPYDSDSAPEFDDLMRDIEVEKQMLKSNRAVRFLAFEKERKEEKGTFCVDSHVGLDEDKIIGDVFLYNMIFGYSNSCHIAYTVDRAKQQRGMAKEMCNAIIDYAFTSIGLNRIEINCYKENIASINTALALGARYEGISYQLMKLKGRWLDMERYSILADSWAKQNINQ
ncbi:MAG: hypothetical protein Kapaf2KO_10740 [Candidatus Kapaibacteriales bacterium]